jgi:hypothetical protein
MNAENIRPVPTKRPRLHDGRCCGGDNIRPVPWTALPGKMRSEPLRSRKERRSRDRSNLEGRCRGEDNIRPVPTKRRRLQPYLFPVRRRPGEERRNRDRSNFEGRCCGEDNIRPVPWTALPGKMRSGPVRSCKCRCGYQHTVRKGSCLHLLVAPIYLQSAPPSEAVKLRTRLEVTSTFLRCGLSPLQRDQQPIDTTCSEDRNKNRDQFRMRTHVGIIALCPVIVARAEH